MSDPSANAPVADPATPPAALPPEGAQQEPTTFDAEYVGRLRDEAAGYRTKLNPFEEAYQGYDEAEVSTLLDLAKALKTDPVSAADWLESAAKAIKEGVAPPPEPTPTTLPPAPAAEDRPLTRAELAAFLEEREATRTAAEQRVAEAAAIDAEMRDLGFEPGTAFGLRLLQVAVENGGDLKAAKEVVDGEKQAIIDDYVAQLAAQGGAAGAGPAAGIPSGERQIKSLNDAEAAMRERLSRLV